MSDFKPIELPVGTDTPRPAPCAGMLRDYVIEEDGKSYLCADFFDGTTWIQYFKEEVSE